MVGEKRITPAENVLITAIISQNGIDEEKLNPVEIGSTLPLANTIGSLADQSSCALRTGRAEAFTKDLEAAKFFTEFVSRKHTPGL